MSFPRLSRVVFSVGVAALLGSLAGSAHAITYDLVPVGNAGNANHTSGFGAVGYDYQIGKYDVTIGQRGGSYTSGALGGVSSSESRFSWSQGKSEESPEIGFRLASPVAVPEPSTYAMALAGLACGGGGGGLPRPPPDTHQPT